MNDSPYDDIIIYLRRFIYKEKQDIKLLMLKPEDNKFYITFKQGKIFALVLNIEKVTLMKVEYMNRDKPNDNF